jgi:RNA polymerase sigma factor (sigma-70 family)
MNDKRELSEEEFRDLLYWLAPDPEQAQREYLTIYRGLIKLFINRGCYEPEECADITINRVAKKAKALAEEYEGRPAHYFFGVAKKVYLEYRRKKVDFEELPAQLSAPTAPEASDEMKFECLDRCMLELNPSEREILLHYYHVTAGAKQREALANRLKIKTNTLRVKVFRLISDLEDCMNKCLGQEGVA